ncbi:MAG: GHKL domain-containing protein, partial [Planctomycetota bacterium]
HNIGNTLNSVNVSAQVLQQCIHDSELTGLSKVIDLLDANAHRLGEFLTQDPQGTRVLPYLRALARRYEAEREEALAEVETLTQSVYHITRIVAAQQSHARVAGVTEQIAVDDLLEDALLIHAERARSSGIEIVIRTDAIDVIRTDRHKALQVLVNLIGNAIDAVEAHDSPVRRVTLVTRTEGDQACFEIQDTGVGIPTELLTKIFQHGFTTKPHGHGFGLHSCALTAKELGGTLTVSSDGVGKGAQFTLRLPLFSEGDETCSTIRKTVCAS